jgi:hypothetical protein
VSRAWQVVLAVTAMLAVAAPPSVASNGARQAPMLRTSQRPLAVVFGDSLITQAAHRLALDLRNVTIDQYATPAVAACYYLGSVKRFAASHRPRVAILEFWGNYMTPCMDKQPYESPGYFAEYKSNLTTMTRALVGAGAHVFLIGTIPDAAQVASGDPLWGRLNEIYAGIARSFARKDVSFGNSQQTIERGGRFSWYLPCLTWESTCDASIAGVVAPPPAGNNIVRSAEGLHFCPRYPSTSNGLYNFVHCSTYSSGTYRYARYIAGAVEDYLRAGTAPTFIGRPLPTPNSPALGISGQVDPYTGHVYPQP